MSTTAGQIPIPSDMPVTSRLAPGQPLAHRYIPTEQPRAVSDNPGNLAGELSFQPITKLSMPEQDLYVRPVNNTRNRPVSPFLKGEVQLSIRGEHKIEFGDSLKAQIKNRNQTASAFLTPTVKSSDSAGFTPPSLSIPSVRPADSSRIAPAKSSPQPADAPLTRPEAAPGASTTTNPPANPNNHADYNQKIRSELAAINQLLFEQIKLKVTEELKRQKINPNVKTSVKISSPLKALDHLPPGKLGRPTIPTNRLQTLTTSSVSRVPKPATTASLTPLPLGKPQAIPAPPTLIQSPQPQNLTQEHHIETLENEVRLLSKEIRHLEEIIAQANSHEQREIDAVEHKVEVDERMLQAVADWRGSLNNLVDSHVTALKYLKKKSDWLEDKVEHRTHAGKHAKLHKKPREIKLDLAHYHPGFSELDTLSSTNSLLNKPLVGESSKSMAAPTIRIGEPAKHPTQIPAAPRPALTKVAFSPNALPTGEVIGKVSLDSSEKVAPGPSLGSVSVGAQTASNQRAVGTRGLNTGVASGQKLGQVSVEAKQPEKILEQQTVVVEPDQPRTEIVQKPTITATATEAEKMTAHPAHSDKGPVVEQQTIMIKPETATVVQPEKEIKVPEPVKEVQAPAFQAVKEMVRQALEKERNQNQQNTSNNLTKENVAQMIKQSLAENTQTGITADMSNKLDELVEKKFDQVSSTEGLQNLVKEAVSAAKNVAVVKVADSETKIPENAPVGLLVKEMQGISPTADVERQILEAAAKEEAVKETTRLAKEAAAKKVADEAKQKAEPLPTSQKPAPIAATVAENLLSADNLKQQFDQLKNRLNSDPEASSTITQAERADFIRKLENLEAQTTITKQLDDLRAGTERRRINQEMRTLLEAVNQRTQVGEDVERSKKIETLKVEQKKQTTPAEKAHVIAEIKQLAREAEARKAAEAARPHVKAQPAYGKMLPNTPTIPNVINGIVRDNKGLLLSTVVIIVKDKHNDPVRAFKTNKIGQFALSTPLPNGTYTLELEKEGYDFDIIEVDVDGSILAPIEIRAK